MPVLTLQSSVVLGHVGNSAAVPALQALRHEAWPIATVTYSNHPGHGGFRGRVTPAAEIAELVEGLGERGALARADAVLSGYLGAAEQGPALRAAVTAVQQANPAALYALDPVIGDGGRIYVQPGVAEFLRDALLGLADVATPNSFELEFLAGRAPRDTAGARAAVETLRRRLGGRRRAAGALVVATGLALDDRPADTLTILLADARGAWRLGHPRLAHPAHGAGDLFAALLLGHLLHGLSAEAAAARAAAGVLAVIGRSAAAGGKDLRLVDSLERLRAPTSPLAVERLD